MKFESRQDAIEVCKHLVNMEYILRAEKKGKGDLGVRTLLLDVIDGQVIVHKCAHLAHYHVFCIIDEQRIRL